MSPQSRIEAHDEYGFMPARGLKPLKGVWRAEAARMARGPKRAPESMSLDIMKGWYDMSLDLDSWLWLK